MLIENTFPRDAERYRGAYSYDEETQKVSGNPARAAIVQDLLKAIRNSAGGDNTTRNHAEAMSIEDMRRWMNYSEAEVPRELASHPELIQTTAQMGAVAKHLMMRAFAASAFTLWTRYVKPVPTSSPFGSSHPGSYQQLRALPTSSQACC